MIDLEIIKGYKSGKSMSFLSGLHGITRYKIKNLLLSNSVKIRNRKDSIGLALNKHFMSNEKIIEMIDGLLLGDGTISKNGRLSIRQKIANKEWIDQISSFLNKNNIENRITEIISKGHYKKDSSYIKESKQSQCRTLNYLNFKEERERWYPNGIKIIPKDVRITNFSLAMFYCGDGSLYKKKNVAQMSFMTECFSEEDVLFLRNKIYQKYGINFNITKQNRLRKCKKDNIVTLLDLMFYFCPSCFDYKFFKEK